MKRKFFLLICGMLFISTLTINAQGVTPVNDPIGRDAPNTITTTVPFLLIAPDTRAGGLGDAGVATTPDINSQHWNPAKYIFSEKDAGVSLSYSPWLRGIGLKDINLAYLAGFKRINKENAISASLLYFDLGSIDFRTSDNQVIDTRNPHELAVDIAYSRSLGRHFSGAIAMRYIYSNLTTGVSVGGVDSYPGKSVAADIAFYYYNDEINTGNIPSTIMWGMNISNMGNKISYTANEIRYFIPTNFRIGVGYLLSLDDYNDFMVTLDFNKLLVPTPPLYYEAGEIYNGDTVRQGDDFIKYGKDPNIPVPQAIFSSWGDAPGVNYPFSKNGKPSVFKEELAEVTISAGVEYIYSKQFALRLGYFHEHAYKGNRKYFTFGAGLKMNVFGLDFSYLLPTTQSNPLQNTVRFTLTFDIGASSPDVNKSKI